MSGKVDVVITTHNGWELSQRCLECLEAQTVEHCVFVADGGSVDGTAQHVRARFPGVQVVSFADDPGYSVLTNHAVEMGSGEIVVLLNNDAFCRPDFLECLIAVFAEDQRIGAVAPLSVREDETTIDSVGIAVDATLSPFRRHGGQPVGDVRKSRPLLFAPGGGADAYRRAAWEQAGGFDERLVFYGADIDLGLRIRLAGWKVAVAPRAIAVHLRSATAGHRSKHSRESGGWARGYMLRRWSVLRTRFVVRVLATELIVVVGNLLMIRDVTYLRYVLRGWRAAHGLPTRRFPMNEVDTSITFIGNLRLRWSSER